MDEMSVRLDDGTDLGEDQKKKIRPWTAQNQFYFIFVLTKTTFFFLLAIVHPN
jgi:hypothetical protein